MQLKNFIARLEKLKTIKLLFDYEVTEFSILEIEKFSECQKINIPVSVIDFYTVANGLKTKNPSFELLEITKTINSFWSNKLWKWLEDDKKIWNDNWWKH